jgi:hypothetical protein
MSVPEKPIFPPNDPASFGASGLPFRESSGRTLRREEKNGREYIDRFRVWFFTIAAENRTPNGLAATVSYRSNPVL